MTTYFSVKLYVYMCTSIVYIVAASGVINGKNKHLLCLLFPILYKSPVTPINSDCMNGICSLKELTVFTRVGCEFT